MRQPPKCSPHTHHRAGGGGREGGNPERGRLPKWIPMPERKSAGTPDAAQRLTFVPQRDVPACCFTPWRQRLAAALPLSRDRS